MLVLDLQMDRSALGVVDKLSATVKIVMLTMIERPEDVLAMVRGRSQDKPGNG